MKKSPINCLSICLLGFIFSLWLVTPMLGTAPEGKSKRFTEWMMSLPEETRVQVEAVFINNLDCVENTPEKQAADKSLLIVSIYRDLRFILAADQLKEFFQLSKGNALTDQLSMPKATCGDCYWIHQLSLSNAANFINSARAAFDQLTYHCTPPIYHLPDHPIALQMMIAEYYLNMAISDTWAAYSSCDCAKAQSALTNTQNALRFTNYAYEGTRDDCDSNAPWKNDLYNAKIWMTNAVNNFPDCIDQTCN